MSHYTIFLNMFKMILFAIKTKRYNMAFEQAKDFLTSYMFYYFKRRPIISHLLEPISSQKKAEFYPNAYLFSYIFSRGLWSF